MEKITDVRHTIHLSTNISQGCQFCSDLKFDDPIDVQINHYLSKHDFKLLHVGSEWGEDRHGATITHTVAVLGK